MYLTRQVMTQAVLHSGACCQLRLPAAAVTMAVGVWAAVTVAAGGA